MAKPELAIDADQAPAAAGAVELGHDEARQSEASMKYLRLLDRIGPERAVHHKPAMMGSGRVVLLQDAADLGQLLHQIALGVEAAGCVHDQPVAAPRLRAACPEPASKATAAASAPVRLETSSRSSRVAHACNCSIAAAPLKVVRRPPGWTDFALPA